MEHYIPRPRELALEQLKAYILEHHLQPGDSLPPEREMCRSWGVNRTTLRSAIARLEASGLLKAVQGSGTRITYRFRISLQNLSNFSDTAAASGFRPETRFLSCTPVACDEHLSHIFHCEPGEHLYKLSCLRLLDDSPVMINSAYYPANLMPGLTEHDLVNGSLLQTIQEKCHLKLEHGSAQISLTQVSSEEAAWLNLPVGASVFQIVTQINKADGSPVEYCRTLGRADKLELVSSMHWEQEKEKNL